MTDMSAAFDAFSIHKRKRSGEDFDDGVSDRRTKRRPFTSLPIRSSPTKPPSIFTTSFASIVGTLTPVDTSEDESPDPTHNYDSSWPNRLPSLTDSQSSSDSSTFLTKAQPSNEDMMDTSMSSPTRPRPGRARSNDILSTLLSPGIPAAHERMPTPISSHFDSRLDALPTAPRHQFPPLRTNLSPMIEQESWVRRPDGLPSPADEVDMEGMMVVEQPAGHSASGFRGLRVTAADADDDDVMDTDGFQMLSSGHSRQQSEQGRTARLHMGFLIGCDKCMQKVPGHYSHILWS